MRRAKPVARETLSNSEEIVHRRDSAVVSRGTLRARETGRAAASPSHDQRASSNGGWGGATGAGQPLKRESSRHKLSLLCIGHIVFISFS